MSKHKLSKRIAFRLAQIYASETHGNYSSKLLWRLSGGWATEEVERLIDPVLEALGAIAESDWKAMLRIIPEGVIHRTFPYRKPEDFELSLTYDEDARYGYPARMEMIRKVARVVIAKATGEDEYLKGGEDE